MAKTPPTSSPDKRPELGEATLAEALAALEARGYRGQFAARPGGRIECLTCHTVLPARETPLEALHRLEGSSDPDDELAVAALRCAACGARGTAVLLFGPNAPGEDGEAFQALRDERRRAA